VCECNVLVLVAQTLSYPTQLATHRHPPPFPQKSDTCVHCCARFFGALRLASSTDWIFFGENRRRIDRDFKTFFSRHSVPCAAAVQTEYGLSKSKVPSRSPPHRDWPRHILLLRATHRIPDERTPIKATRLRLFQRHLRSLFWVWVWVWDWVHTPPHTLLHTLLFFSPPSFHTISLSLAFTSAW
jgi:hypothetical protein